MNSTIKVKLVTKNRLDLDHFSKLPRLYPQVEFTFDRDCRDYDWFVVYCDLPPSGSERLTLNEELLACPRERTALITYEPSSIKHYGADYVRQFGLLLTSQEPEMIPHANHHAMPPVGFWYYGDVDQALRLPQPPVKTQQISVFGSGKRGKHSLHRQRFDFLNGLEQRLDNDGLEVFGRDRRPVDTKSEALDDFRYHIAVENHISPDHWTEKLSDCFLGYALPFYVGCPNAADYFPEDSLIPLDIRDVEGAVERIREAVSNDEFSRRLPAIIEARERVLKETSLPNLLAKHIVREHAETGDARCADGAKILSRHKAIRSTPLTMMRYALGKATARRKTRRLWQQFEKDFAGSGMAQPATKRKRCA